MQHIIIYEGVNITMLMHVSNCSKTHKMCDKTLNKDSKMLKFVSNYFKTQEMSEKAAKKRRCLQ